MRARLVRARGWAAGLIAAALTGCLADLRPEALQALDAPAAADSARAALRRAEAAQSPGGKDWRQVAGAELSLTDDWSGLARLAASPWPSDPQRLRLTFRPARDEGLLEVLEEEGTPAVTFGLHGWNGWRREPGEAAEYGEHEEALFWIPTLAYFLEGNLRLGREAGLVDLAGAAEHEGEACDLVYVTWGGFAPSTRSDQYLAWVRRRDGLIVRLDFTVRDMARFLVTSAFYQDHREVDGFLLPHRVVIGDAPDDPLHVLTVERWSLGGPLAQERLAPEPRPARAKPPP